MSRNRIEKIQKLLSTESAIIANISESKNVNVDSYLKELLPIITCECGAEIRTITLWKNEMMTNIFLTKSKTQMRAI
ncbi:MAG: hypothetical protein ABSA79_11140 [Candidatus Bathyarchaeia archaeon]|jgi:hypothetical protein